MSASHAHATHSRTGLRHGDIEKLEKQLASTKELLDSIVGRLREVLQSLQTASQTMENSANRAYTSPSSHTGATGAQAWRSQGSTSANQGARTSPNAQQEAWKERMERLRRTTQAASAEGRKTASPFSSTTRASGTRMQATNSFDADAWRERIRQRVEERIRARREEQQQQKENFRQSGAQQPGYSRAQTQQAQAASAQARAQSRFATSEPSEFERARMAREARLQQAAREQREAAAQAETKRQAEVEAQARRLDMARQRAEAEARLKAQAEARARAQAEREAQRLKREQEARERARARAEEARARAERERRRRQQEAEESSGMSLYRAFEILSLTFGATKTEVKKAYRSLARTCHPDLGGCEEQMKDLNLAYELAMASSR